MTAPIGRVAGTAAVGAPREGGGESERAGARPSIRGRDGVSPTGPGAGDQLTISPDALRELSGPADDGPGGGGDGARQPVVGASAGGAIADDRDALRLAFRVADVLRAEPARAAHVHDVLSVHRALGLLRG